MVKPKIKFVLIKMHVRIGDIVMVISGLDKGKIGKIIKVFIKKGKVLVEGINVVIKHLKPSQINL
jgi:large subunit ribosomal protein L24